MTPVLLRPGDASPGKRSVQLRAERIDPMCEEFRSWVSVLNACMREEWGELANQNTVQEVRSSLGTTFRNPIHLMVKVRGRMVGCGLIQVPHQQESEDGILSTYVMVRVLRAVQGFGIGKVLLDAVEDEARKMGVNKLWSITAARSLRDDRATRIVRRAGYVENRLVSRMDLQLAAGRSLKNHFQTPEGFHIVICVDSLPEEFPQALAQLNQRQEHHGEAHLVLPQTPQKVLSIIEDCKAIGHSSIFAIAVHSASGKVAGWAHTDAASDNRITEESGMGIDPSFKNVPGLGEAILANLIDVTSATLTGIGRVRYFANYNDAHIIGVHRNVGFEDIGVYRDWFKHLD